jgi:excisionase family DNA binding protein
MAFNEIQKLKARISELEKQLKVRNAELLDLKQTAEYLKLQPSYIYSLVHQVKIPHHKPNGKKLYFFKHELNEWILGTKVRSIDELEEDYNKEKNSGI